MKLELVLFTTSACNLSCQHCKVMSKNTGNSISVADLERVADQYRPHKVNLLGGEPLMWPHLERAFELFERVTVSTNGVLVKERLDMLENARAVLLSVEGTEAWTDKVRGKGVWKRVMEAARLLRERKITTAFRCSYSLENLKDIPKLLEVASKEETYDENQKLIDHTPAVFFPRLDKPPLSIQDQVWVYTTMLKFRDAWVDIPQWWAYAGRKEAYCPAGEKRLALFWDRTLQPCQWQQSPLGTLDDPADFVWDNARTFSKDLKRPVRGCYGCASMETCRSGCKLSKAFINCPLKRGIDVSMVDDRDLSYKVVQDRISSLRVTLRGVLSC